MAPRQHRWIYHITHIDNLESIVDEGCLLSDREMSNRMKSSTVIGFDRIKQRRLNELQVTCHPGTYVGDYVPFYFCPRSPMLYVIYKANSELKYGGGQRDVIHLVSSVERASELAGDNRWAFSDGNAGARYTRFTNELSRFDEFVDASAIVARDWRDPAIKEKKQAEFLYYGSFPLEGVLGIGVLDEKIAQRARALVQQITHQIGVRVKPRWYY